MGIVHHTDAVREWAYDRKSDIGRLDKALGRGGGARLDGGRHEERLGEGVFVRQVNVSAGLFAVRDPDILHLRGAAQEFATARLVSELHSSARP